MEPGLRGREDARASASCSSHTATPLWSPAFGAGKTATGGDHAARCKAPLWSPAFGAGKTSSNDPDPGPAET